MSGFASGEGCFMVRLRNNHSNISSPKVELIFQITQHIRDDVLLQSLIKFLDCGKFRERKRGLACDFIVYKFSDLFEKIIPFFEKYPLLGVKTREFKDFLSVANLKSNSTHLTPEGLDQIRQIQSNMNTKRLD